MDGGQGLVGENGDLGEVWEEWNVMFVGGSRSGIWKMGRKDVGRERMKEGGVGIVGGCEGIVKDVDDGV